MPIQQKFELQEQLYIQQQILSEVELLACIEQHYGDNPVSRIYVAPHCYILPEFFKHALAGMLKSFEEQEAYEACARVVIVMKLIQKQECLLP